jgi:hypothetical protein
MRTYAFAETGLSEDWRFAYKLASIDGWTVDDEIVLEMTPDYVSWDDYGFRSRSSIPTAALDAAPYLRISSADATGEIELIDPNVIQIVLPWNRVRQLGPGVTNVKLQYWNLATSSRLTILNGRLPIMGDA